MDEDDFVIYFVGVIFMAVVIAVTIFSIDNYFSIDEPCDYYEGVVTNITDDRIYFVNDDSSGFFVKEGYPIISELFVGCEMYYQDEGVINGYDGYHCYQWNDLCE